jgi:hypothetical protein
MTSVAVTVPASRQALGLSSTFYPPDAGGWGLGAVSLAVKMTRIKNNEWRSHSSRVYIPWFLTSISDNFTFNLNNLTLLYIPFIAKLVAQWITAFFKGKNTD